LGGNILTKKNFSNTAKHSRPAAGVHIYHRDIYEWPIISMLLVPL